MRSFQDRVFYRLIFLVAVSLVWGDTVFALEFKRCHITVEANSMDAECATLTRPENPKNPKGKTIDLFVVKLAAKTVEPAADAFTIIQGGPGASSVDMAINFQQILELVRIERDVLIVDQRGTGRSNKLQCDIDQSEFDEAAVAAQAQLCATQLAEHDLSAYTTSVAVQDLDAVRAAAGYAQLSVYGVSYGTRVAQHYLRRFPQHTRALIIDGVVDIGLNLAGAEVALRSQNAFDAMVSRCNTSTVCVESFGDIKKKFEELRIRLVEEPQSLTFAHPLTGAQVEHTISEHDLLGTIRMMPYATEDLSLMPMMIAQAHNGNYAPLAAKSVSLNESFLNIFATGMHNSVVCTEDFPFVRSDAAALAKDTLIGSLMADSIRISCEYWPQGIMDDDLLAPFNSSRPVLILSGETDPITPPANGERAAEMFDNALHLIVPSHGHGVLARGCVPFLVRDFLKTAELSELKTECIKRERAMPFFIDSTGPKP